MPRRSYRRILQATYLLYVVSYSTSKEVTIDIDNGILTSSLDTNKTLTLNGTPAIASILSSSGELTLSV